MEGRSTQSEANLVAELNDLLQLDHDAVQAYTVAIENVADPMYRDTLIRFRGDHERHIEELTRLVREHGGVPLELSHIPTGLFKLAVQKVGAKGGDRALLLAFKANERQVRDKYRRAAAMAHPPGVAEVIRRNAEDEQRHYAWALEVVDDLGAGPETTAGKVEGAFERVHAATANVVEGAERKVMESTERLRRSAMHTAREMGPRVRETAGSGLESAAAAMDRAGSWVETKDGVPAAKAGSFAHSAADRLENAATYVRTHEMREFRRDLERQIDLHPLRSTLIALGAGFIVGQILR